MNRDNPYALTFKHMSEVEEQRLIDAAENQGYFISMVQVKLQPGLA